jgi:hypothetical protein
MPAKATKAVKKNSAPAPATPSTARLEMWPVSRLVPYIRNPRKHDGAIDRMVSSIKEFGFKTPVLVKSDGTLIDGHLRLKGAIKYGLTDVPVLLCDEWTDGQVKAFRLLANRSATWGEFDQELLHLELTDLSEEFGNLDLVTGFDLTEINDLLGFEDKSSVEEQPATDYSQKWLVLIECSGEPQQVELLERFMGEGLACRAMNG